MTIKIHKKGFLYLSAAVLTTVFFTAVFSLKLNAQQTVFNVPAADVLDKGKVYAELDAGFKLNNDELLKRFSGFTPRVVVGVGGKTEIGLNITGNVNPGADSTTLVPTVKHKFYESERNKLAFFGGTNFYIPVRNRSYKIGSYSYAAAAKTFHKTRVTTGGFVASKNVFAAKASRGGAQLAVEQTINKKLTLAADWLTGKHANGYFTPGVIYKPTPKLTAYLSYSIGNADASKGNHFFLFELGYNFN